MFLQVECVTMEKHQEEAYNRAVDDYRAVSRARLAKLSGGGLTSVVGVLPQRQISNYFVQFRKVFSFVLYFPLTHHLIPIITLLCSKLFVNICRLQIILYWFGEFTVMTMLCALLKGYILREHLVLNVPWRE